jgi:hypothetical protein
MNFHRIACSVSLLLSFVQAGAAEPAPGEYIPERGWGTLSIARKGGNLNFSITAWGANGHSCGIDGAIRNGQAVLSDLAPGSSCQVTFRPDPGGIAVVLGQPGDCRDYCGMRASFDGRYLVPAAGCRNGERKAAQGRFGKLYKSKDYAGALPLLQNMLTNCAATLYWLEEAQIRNDIAVTLYHLDRKEECLAVLMPTIDTYGSSEKAIEESLPPTDADSILPMAKAAWYNAKLCGKQ